MRWSRRVPVVLALVASAAACAPSAAAPPPTAVPALDDNAITVGSFDFAESVLLGELYGQALAGAGFEVVYAAELGPRELVAPALASGLVEFVPEYAGSALRFHRLGEDTPSSGPATTHRLLAEALAAASVTVLEPAPAENTNAFVVTRQTAEGADLHTIGDLAPVAGQMTFGGPPECPTRALCLVGLEDTYGVVFGSAVALDAGGPMTHQALADGGVDVGLLFSSDPALDGGDLVVLVDDRGLQPAENITPLVRTELLARWGEELVAVVDAVSARLTQAELRRLNGQAVGVDPTAVAEAWLAEQELP